MSGLTDISVSNYMDIKIDTTEITDIEGFSGLTDETNVIEVKQYNRKFPRKLIGSSAGSTIELTCSFNPSTASYQALMAAKASGESKAFEVIYYGDSAKSAAASAKRTFTAVVTGYSESAEFDTQRTCTWTIAIDSDIEYTNGATMLRAKADKAA
ncbi:hypothetical protein LDV99_004498 [Vibrio parahaemolyticus]|nr:hypothetical protein [Vibrio parahaemolyticus]